MNISERVHAFIQPVKTSFGTAVTKASETVKKACEIASKILKVLFTPVTYLYHAVKSLLNRMSKNPAPAAQPEDSIRRQSDAADLDRTFENPKASIFRSALEQQFFENLKASILGTDETLSSRLAPAAQPEDSIRRQSDAADLDRTFENPKASIFRSALEQQFFENLKASILGTDETLSSRLAREEIKREAARRLCLDLDPLALPSLLRHPSSDTQNSAAQPEDSIRRQSDAADLDRTAAAVKIQTLGRDYIARKLQKAEKAKAEARPAAAAFLTNITQQAVAQYANQTQVSHRTPASLSTATSIKKAHWTFIQASHILAPVTRGGSAADFPPLTNEMQNKSARRRNLKPLSN